MLILIMLVCAALFWWGGKCWLPARRFIMPTVLALTGCFLIHSLWPLTMLSAIGAFHQGYSEKSPLYHIFGAFWDRGIWGLIAGLALSLGLILTNHLTLAWFLVYLGISFLLENCLQNIKQSIGDPIIGFGFALILLLIH